MTTFTENLGKLQKHYSEQLQYIDTQAEIYREKLEHVQIVLEGIRVSFRTDSHTETVSEPVTEEPLTNSTRRGRTSNSVKAKTVDKDLSIEPQRKRQGPKMVIDLRDEYQDLSKIEAVQKVLEDRAGKAVHIEKIIAELFGDLSSDELLAEKKRMNTILWKGVNQGMWRKLKRPRGAYISG